MVLRISCHTEWEQAQGSPERWGGGSATLDNHQWKHFLFSLQNNGCPRRKQRVSEGKRLGHGRGRTKVSSRGINHQAFGHESKCHIHRTKHVWLLRGARLPPMLQTSYRKTPGPILVWLADIVIERVSSVHLFLRRNFSLRERRGKKQKLKQTNGVVDT